jgi:predicted dienelactone hydrolase
MASHGYVVASVSHTHDTYLEFPDGRFVASSRAPGLPSPSRMAELDAHIRVWVDDVRFVADELGRLNASDARWAGRLDLERLGVFGHSYGGATAIEAAALDTRFRAAAHMDGILVSGARASGGRALRQPALFVLHDAPMFGGFDPSLGNTWDKLAGPGYAARVHGAEHLNFTEAGILASFFGTTSPLVGSIEPVRALRVAEAYLLAFFDRHLVGYDAPLLDGPSADFPEVELRAKNAPPAAQARAPAAHDGG